MILKRLGCLKCGRPFCVYVAGAGGKTSWIHYLADKGRREGMRVLILTSTHMYEPTCFGVVREESCGDAGRWAREIGERMGDWGVVIAGRRAEQGKIAWIGDDVYERVRECADLILIEADGSRHLPVKVPSDKEPVIFSDADLIFVTLGMKAVGQPLRDVCHRADLAARMLGRSGEAAVSGEDVERMYWEGYETKLRKCHPGIPILPVWVYQDDTASPRGLAQEKEGAGSGIVWELSGIYRLEEDTRK